MNRTIKSVLWFLVIALVGYNSVYFRKLDEVKKSSSTVKFDATAYAATFMREKLPPILDKSVEINDLMQKLRTNPEAAFNQYAHALGISNIRYFLVRGQGVVQSIGENDIEIACAANGKTTPVKIATQYVFGNAVRDASGLIDIKDFENTMDLNNISEALNDIVRKDVLPDFVKNAAPGKVVNFVGAIELNQKHLKLTETVEAIPVKITFQ